MSLGKLLFDTIHRTEQDFLDAGIVDGPLDDISWDDLESEEKLYMDRIAESFISQVVQEPTVIKVTGDTPAEVIEKLIKQNELKRSNKR
jgi:hypothetical protein